MEADWSVALAADDPVIVIPWTASEDESGCRFIDLRLDRGRIEEIAEARVNPALRFALLALNSAESPLRTAKCDVWTTCDEPYDPYEMDAAPGETAFGAGSYIDLLARDAEIYESFSRQEPWLRQVTKRLHGVAAKAARTELVLRRSRADGAPGFGVSWFVEGCGATAERAEQMWSEAFHLALTVIMESL